MSESVSLKVRVCVWEWEVNHSSQHLIFFGGWSSQHTHCFPTPKFPHLSNSLPFHWRLDSQLEWCSGSLGSSETNSTPTHLWDHYTPDFHRKTHHWEMKWESVTGSGMMRITTDHFTYTISSLPYNCSWSKRRLHRVCDTAMTCL